jgi:hypothetical protein
MQKRHRVSYSESLARVIFIVLLGAQSEIARADGSPTPALPADTLTHFEYFVLTNCTPCVRESYAIATVPIPAMKAPNFSAIAPTNPVTTTRPGQLRLELLRAYPAGFESRQHLAMRVALTVTTGTEGAQYPVGAGVLDEDEVPALAAALSQMSKAASAAADDSSLRLVEMEFHADSVRMGTVRTGTEVLVYVQIAPPDMPRFALKQVWELPATYFPSQDIGMLERAVSQVSAKIRAIRAR